MAAAFNLTAQINLQGPRNIKPIIADIKRQISSAKIGLNLDIGANSAKNISSISRRLNNLSKAAIQANTNVSNLGNTLSSLSSSFNTASSAASTHASSTARTAQAVASAGKAIQQSRTQIEEFGKQAGLAIKRFAAFSTVTAPIYALTNAITNGFKEFVSFNREIVRLSQVTGQSVSDLGAVSKEITRLSTSLGVASSDLLQVATTLAQAGFSAEDTKVALEALAKSALAPSFDSLTDTTEGAIAAMRQFGIQTQQLDGALGSINAVAAAFAVEASDIITAVQRTGGVFSAASRGVSEGTDALNEFIAIFTSVRATTRESAETIATGLRTIFTRIQRAKTIEQLREFGIELQDTEDKFVGLYEATRRLSEGLSKIDPRSIGFATISEELGGFRQIGKVIPLIQQFAVAEQALAVAQQGTKSTSKDALIAQQSLAVQFEKTRQNFQALIREIGDSSSFKAFVGLSLKLGDAFINVARSLKPLLPLLLLYSSIKAGGAIKELGAGIGGVFGLGGGRPPTGGTGGPVVTGGPSGGSPSNNATALTNNTTVLNVVTQALTNLNTSILALNQNIVNNNSLLLNRPVGRFATGGLVPGSGNSDTYPAMLTPGEFVIRKKAVETIGASNLAQMNSGGYVQKYAEGGISKKLQQKIVDSGSYENFLMQSSLDPFGMTSQKSQDKRKIYNFGLIGLRSGTRTSANRTELRKLNNGQNARIHIGFLQGKAGFEQQIETDIDNNLNKTIMKTAGAFSSQIGGKQLNRTSQKRVLEGAVLSSAVGNVFESALQIVGAPFIDKIEAIKAIDFPFGLGNAAKLFGSFPSNIPTDATRTIAGSGKGISDFVGQINRFLGAVAGNKFTESLAPLPTKEAMSASSLAQRLIDRVKGNINEQSSINSVLQSFGLPGVTKKTKVDALTQRLGKNTAAVLELQTRGYASGGSIEDTVPALLTPGEFVINKNSARRIGYNNLNRLNKADKVQGFNRGGAVGVQKFAGGGSVLDTIGGGAGAIAAITAVILPEMEKLADSFKKLDGQSASLASGLSGAAKQASSLVLSAGIALQVSGADKRTTGLTQAGLGITGAVGGFITEKSSKDLERALLKTSERFSDFDKTLQDLTQAPTEELRIEAAARLEKTFMNLDASVRNSISSIDSLELAQKAGESLNNFSLSVITGISAFSALKTATEAMVASASARVAMAAPLAAGVAGPIGPAVGIGTKLLNSFGGLIPVVGALIPIISLAVEGFSLWTSTAKKSAEQLDKVYSSLAELTKNSNAFNLANQNFITKLLPEFRRLRQTNPEQLQQRLGTITTDNGFNELNLNFKTLLRSRFAEKGFTFDEEQNLADFQRSMSTTAAGVSVFAQVIKDTTKEFERQQFIQAKRAANKELSPEDAGKEFDKLLKAGAEGRKEIDRVNQTYVGAANLQILALRDLTDANNRVKLSLVNLDNILVSLGAKINMSIDKALNSFDDLDLKIATMSGEPDQIGGRFLRRDISVLENIGGVTEQQIKDVTSTVRGLIQVQPGTTEATRFGEIATQVQAVRTFQQDLPAVLRTIQTTGGLDSDKIFKALEQNLGKKLRTIAGTGQEADKSVNTILRDASAQLFKAVQGDKESITNMEDLARNAPALAAALKNGETSVKVFKDVLEASAKLQDKLAEQQKRLVELNNQLNQSIIQRTQTELQNSIELKRVFGENIKLSELNNVFDAGIRQLSNIGRGVPSGGTTNVGIISSELNKAKKAIAEFDQQIKLSTGDQAKTKDLTDKRNKEVIIVNRLTQALSTLATSSDKTKNALDKIAEAQDKFTKRRNFLSEYLDAARNNPEKFLQMQKTVASVRAAETGRFMDATQARLFVTEGASVLEQMGRSRAEIDALITRAVEFQAKGARPLNKNDQNIIDDTVKFLRSGGKSQLDAMASQLPAFLKPLLGSLAEKFNIDAPESALAKAQSEQKAASDQLIKNLNERIGVVTSTTDNIFTSFNNELGLVLPGIIRKLRLLEGKTEITTKETKTTSIPQFQPSLGLLAEIQEGVKGLPLSPPRVRRSYRPGRRGAKISSQGGAELGNKTQLETLLKNNPEVALESIRQRLLQESDMYVQEFGAIPESLANARISISKLQKQLREERRAFEESQKNKVEPQTPLQFFQNRQDNPFNIPSGPPTTNRPTGTSRVSNNNDTQFVSDVSIQRFQEGANAFSKSLNDAPLQNLSDSLSSFNSASQALINSLQSFEAKFSEGMKGTIAHDASVQVSFSDSLAVDLPKNNNTISMVDMVVNAIRPLIATEITRGLKREV
jgi:TP901 family phage tail tape measure protein